MTRKWMIELRRARYETINDAAKAANVSVRLLDVIEEGSVTVPGIARRIGKAYGMDTARINEITCEAVRRMMEQEARMSTDEKRRHFLQESYR